MAIRKFTSVKEVIRDVYKYYKDDGTVDEETLVYFIDDALNLLNLWGTMEELTAEIPITNHVGMVPCGFHLELQLADSSGRTMTEATGTINITPSDSSGAAYIKGQPVTTNEVPMLVNVHSGSVEQQYYFNNECIYTTVDNGFIYMNYVGIRVDSEGYPMIPDIEAVRQALRWYCILSLFQKKMFNGTTNIASMVEMAQNNWDIYSPKARAAVNQLTIPQMENFKRSHVRLMPRMNQFNSFFRNVATEERLYNH